MSIKSHLNGWKSDPSIMANISAWRIIPERTPRYEDFPPELDSSLKDQIKNTGINALYAHQKNAWDEIQSGKNIVLVTGTSSGKTLAYSLPILHNILKNDFSRALFLYPTKSLAHDQLTGLNTLIKSIAFAYDGDTPQIERRSIRQKAKIIVSNPDMLHLGILPYHIQWDDFFSNLKYIVLDEIHIYRGVFGSHVANVIRRIKRIAAHYGASPQFILASATIGNPLDFARALIAEDLILINDDYSARGEKHFIIFNPPVIDHKIGLRASMQNESVRLAADLIKDHFQTILFGRSRKSVEFMLTKLQEKFPRSGKSFRSYRSGYLPSRRREIEAGLRSGDVLAVTATSALELGVDIGGLDAAILAGYPGTIAGTLQQAGRSGRTKNSSVSILVTSSNPLDQYLALHPEYLFSTNPEFALIDPDNLLIVLTHLQCALYELPFSDNSRFGNFSIAQTQDLLELLRKSGQIYFSNAKYFWMSEIYPAASISLRTTSLEKISLRTESSPGKILTLGQIDRDSSYWMVHPGAIYLHEGETYLVKDLDFTDNCATLAPASRDYYTEPERQTSFSVNKILQTDQLPGASKFLGEITVRSQVTGFKKVNWLKYEILGHEPLDLPAITLQTIGFWITLSEETEYTLKIAGLWTSSPNDYGPDWEEIRKKVLTRDEFTCQICGNKNDFTSLHVHHKMPIRSFQTYREANQLTNLVSLCPRCHLRAESVVRVNSGIRGLGYVLHSLAPLLLMCDPGDLGMYADVESPLGDSRPVALLYEYIPSGIGFSKSLYQRATELIEKSHDLVSHCACLDGCPSCVGPGSELGSGGKQETLAILKQLCRLASA